MNKSYFGVAVAAVLLLSSSTSAQLIHVPNLPGFGNSSNAFPFSAAPNGPMRYQQIYSASAFPHGGTIDKIMFRNDEPGPFASTYGPISLNLQVAFAYAATTVATASATFANNIGDDFTVVLDEVVTQSDDGSGPPNTFDFDLDVANTFNYDPSQGDLLVQILVRNQRFFTVFDASDQSQQNVTTRVYAGGINSVAGIVGSNHTNTRPYGLVTQFEFVPIPEPSTIAQFGVMLLLVSVRRRFRHG